MMLRIAMWMALAGIAGAGSAQDDLLKLRIQLASDRQASRAAGWAAELKFAAAHRAEPDVAAEVMYDVALAQRRNDPRSAAKILEDLVEAFPKAQPWADIAAYELARSAADRAITRAKAVELLEKVAKAERLDPARKADALLTLARLQLTASNNAEAIARFRAFLESCPDHTGQCAEALASIGMALIELKRPKEAFDTYLKLGADYPWEIDRRRNLLLAVAQALRVAQEPEAAAAAYEKLLDELPKGDPRRAQTYMGLALLRTQQNNSEAAIAIYRRMATDATLGASYQASAYRQLFALQRQANDHAGIIRLAYELIATQPSSVVEPSGYGSNTLPSDLVEALIAEGRVDEAIAMARAYFRLTAMAGTHSSDAVLAVVRALKTREASLRSANAFIAYVEHGPEGPDAKAGTADDFPDPTAAYRLPPEPERDRLFTAAANRFINDSLQLGYLCIFWDKPDEALRAFRRHYLESFEPTRLQAAVALLTRALRAVGRPEAEIDAFFEYQNCGPAGKDGKLGTADDLKDPILQGKAPPKK